jgi:hypothetical protein
MNAVEVLLMMDLMPQTIYTHQRDYGQARYVTGIILMLLVHTPSMAYLGRDENNILT